MTSYRSFRRIRHCMLALVVAATAACGISDLDGENGAPKTSEPNSSEPRSSEPKNDEPRGSGDEVGAEVNEHWHAAFAISVCGTFLEPLHDVGEDRAGIHT